MLCFITTVKVFDMFYTVKNAHDSDIFNASRHFRSNVMFHINNMHLYKYIINIFGILFLKVLYKELFKFTFRKIHYTVA